MLFRLDSSLMNDVIVKMRISPDTRAESEEKLNQTYFIHDEWPFDR